MPISPLAQKLRPFFDSVTASPVDRPATEQRYLVGTQFQAHHVTSSQLHLDKNTAAILRIIDNFNSEPVFVGNGVFLFNKTSRIFTIGAPLTPSEALVLLNEGTPVHSRLARVRPAESKQSLAMVQIVPLDNFSYQLDSQAALLSWWKVVGRNFCDGIF